MRVLHITDLHIVAGSGERIYGVDSHVSLRAVLDAALASRPDLVVATGDLVERGDRESYGRLGALLRSTGLPTFVVPGNHDSPRRMAEALCGGRIRQQPVYDEGAWRFVFLDSRVRGEPHGELGAAAAEQLDRALDTSEGRHVFVALHHTPIAPCPSFGCQLLGGRELLERLAARENVRAVVAGHSHIEAAARFGDIQVMTTPSTCAEALHAPAGECARLDDFWSSHRFDPLRHGYRLLELDAEGGVRSRVHWVPDPPEGASP